MLNVFSGGGGDGVSGGIAFEHMGQKHVYR